MNDEQRTLSTEQYFQQYREKLRRLSDVEDRRVELERSFTKDRDYLINQTRQLQSEIESMRRVITRVVDEGIDPTTAKIMMDESYHRDLWHGDPFSTRGYDSIGSVDLSDAVDMGMTIGSITTTGSISLSTIGATGATGPIGGYITGYGQGANGPGGPFSRS